MSNRSYVGKIVYVVGGSLGIGRAAAKALARRGADVLVFARRAGPLEEAVREIEGTRTRPDQRVAGRALDVCDRAQVVRVMDEAVASFGAPDVLLNCAGRARPDYFERITVEQLCDTMQLNLVGSWNTIQVLLPHLRATRGHVVNTASIAGLIGIFGYTDYAASKFALIGFSEALRSELRRSGVRVSVLCPPDTDTPGLADENRTKPPETHAVAAAARCMSADDVAAALVAGMERGRFLIIPGWSGWLTVLAKRWLPGVVTRAIDRAVDKASSARGPVPVVER